MGAGFFPKVSKLGTLEEDSEEVPQRGPEAEPTGDDDMF